VALERRTFARYDECYARMLASPCPIPFSRSSGEGRIKISSRVEHTHVAGHSTCPRAGDAFHASYSFSLLPGRRAGKREGLKKAWKLVERGYFTRVTLDAFARGYSFALGPPENSRRDAGSRVLACRDIPRGIRRRNIRDCSSIATFYNRSRIIFL